MTVFLIPLIGALFFFGIAIAIMHSDTKRRAAAPGNFGKPYKEPTAAQWEQAWREKDAERAALAGLRGGWHNPDATKLDGSGYGGQ